MNPSLKTLAAAIVTIAIAVTIAVAIIFAVPPEPELVDLSSFYPKPGPGAWRFDPKPDITPYELALAIQAMFGSGYFVPSTGSMVQAMPPSAQRHWVAPPQPELQKEEHNH